jgi:uncharacterized protein (TIGR04551 family)
MRCLWTCWLVMGLALCSTPGAAWAQSSDDSSGDGSGEAKPADEKPADAKPADAKPVEPGVPPLPPVADGDLPPAEGGEALPPPPPGFNEVSGDQLGAVKPPLNLLDLHGYLRVRGDLMDGLDLGLKARSDAERGAAYPQFPRSATGKKDTLAGANMRFRLEPTLNISEDVRVMAQIDMLDNLVLGSTPDGYPANTYYPMVAFSQTQNPPIAGWNSTRDSIMVKRAWGEVMTPLGMLRFGRMGSQWGLGMLANDGGPSYVDNGPFVTRNDPFAPTGMCYECDYASTVDRIMFVTKVFGHYIIPMVDFTAEGPYFSSLNEIGGQDFDIEQLDDVNSWIIAIAKRDKPEDIKETLQQDDWSLNYGAYFVFRNQSYDATDYNFGEGGLSSWSGGTLNVSNYTVRNIEAYIPDVWVRLMMGKLRIELEFCMIIGKIGYDTLGPNLDVDGNLILGIAGEKVSLLQYGGVFQADYKFLDDALTIGLELGFASGDDSPGFGVHPFEEKQFDHRLGDDDINNFRFHPGYNVDLILWRQIIGTVTDALYVKPTVQYNITEAIGGKLSVIYSSALETSSTRGKASPLGLEFDVDLFYFSTDNFHAGLSYGLLIPFSGMSDLGDDELPGGELAADHDKDAEIAHRVMGRLVLFF